MSIKIVITSDNEYAPMFHCDTCGGVIKEVGHGLYTYPAADGAEVRTVHRKRPCSTNDDFPCMELADLMAFLVHNHKVDVVRNRLAVAQV
jgi:hypothetical protein